MDSILNLISELGEKEESIQGTEFVSPIFYNTQVAMRIQGLVHTLSIPNTKPGWYRLVPKNLKEARILSPADFLDIEKYLEKFPKIRLILTMRQGDYYQAIPLKNNKFGMILTELKPVLLFDDTVMDFDQVICRYDGLNLWFESLDMINDPLKAEYLRDQLLKITNPKNINMSGLSVEEKAAYTIRLNLDTDIIEKRKKGTIQGDVEHAGGQFIKYVERKDHYSVTYIVDGEQFTSYISKDSNHKVLSAGLCLEGNDSTFDLKSLVTVIREAKSKRVVHKYALDRNDPGDYYDGDDEDYDY